MTGSCGCRGAGALRKAGVAGPREAERESSPPSADGRASGVADAAARLAAGLGATDTTCSGAPGERGGAAEGWASEGGAAEGGEAGVAESPSESLDDEVDDVGDGGAPAAQPPGAALEPLPEASVCRIGKFEAWGEATREKEPPSPHGRCYAHFYVLVSLRRLCPLLSVAHPRSRVSVFSAAWSAPLKNRLCILVSPSNPDGFASDLKTAA